MQERSAMQRPLKECSAGALNEGALNAGALSEAAPSEGVLSEEASSEGALSEASFSEEALSEGAFGEELWVAKKVCSSYTRAAEDGATTKVEWRSEVQRNEGASSSKGGGEVNSGVLRAAAHWQSGSRQ